MNSFIQVLEASLLVLYPVWSIVGLRRVNGGEGKRSIKFVPSINRSLTTQRNKISKVGAGITLEYYHHVTNVTVPVYV